MNKLHWLVVVGVVSCLLPSCKQGINHNMHAHTNELIHSTSPYLQQHAHNPVDWREWTSETLELARKEDKPILVSIGYSSCHWCHVMEKESFEDTAVANLMNKYFINIKVDREERPDVDQIYMDAVHAMGLNGGWPLNVFLTSDQKPFYGGTYFPKQGWVNLLDNVADAYANNREKINESAEVFTKSLQAKESEKYKLEGTEHRFTESEMDSLYQKLSDKFDAIDGGIKKSPKFPMPAVWQLLATYYQTTEDDRALRHLNFTLEKVADGGIYDHIGGGFARYSTDEEWHVPHFEKMLYDNGQLLSLYANGYKLTKNPKFLKVIDETVTWLEREMKDESGGFYSALDADSEGEEGKFYVWSAQELIEPAGNDFEWLSSYYDISENGNWEGKNVVRVVKKKEEIMSTYNLTSEVFDARVRAFKQKVLEQREARVRPGLDDKIIAGWNGLVLSGLSEAYQATGEQRYLELARLNAHFLSNQVKKGRLKRFPNKDMEGFLEDYAAVIQGFIKFYETTFDKRYIETAREMLERVEGTFYDETENLYFFTATDDNLIARKKEFFDNVIPSSNSIMAWNLVHLGTHYYDDDLVNKGKSMVAQAKELIQNEPEYLCNWGLLALELSQPFAEVVIVGEENEAFGKELNQYFIPNKVIAGAKENEVNTPLFQYKGTNDGATTVYVCYDKSCKRPVTSVAEALEMIE